MLITNIKDFKNKIYEVKASSINFSTISSDTINFWNDIKKLGIDLNQFKKLFIEKFGEQSFKVLEAKLSSDQLASNYEDSNTDLETTEFVNDFDEIIDFCNSYLLTYSANNTLATNEDIFKPKKPKYDITQSEKSLASAVAPLISKMDIMPLPDLKTEFTNILKDPSVHASEATRKKWFDTLTKATNKYSLMSAITNLYLKAAKLGLTESSENNIDVKKYLTQEEIYEIAYKLKQFFRSDVDLKKLGMMIADHHYNNDLFPLGDISHITKALNSTSDEGTRMYLRVGLMSAFRDKGIDIYKDLNLKESYYDRCVKESNDNLDLTNIDLKSLKGLPIEVKGNLKGNNILKLINLLKDDYYFNNNKMLIDIAENNSIVISGFPTNDYMSVPAYFRNIINDFCDEYGYSKSMIFKNKMSLKLNDK